MMGEVYPKDRKPVGCPLKLTKRRRLFDVFPFLWCHFLDYEAVSQRDGHFAASMMYDTSRPEGRDAAMAVWGVQKMYDTSRAETGAVK